MAKPAVQEAQLEAARLRTLIRAACRSVQARMDAIPIPEKDPNDKTYDWEVIPTVPFYIHGTLACALECLEEADEHLARAAGATPESIAEEWIQYNG